jgi:peptide/nickel transport system permease protein
MTTWSALWRHRRARIGLVILGLFVAMAAFGPFLVHDPSDLVGVPLEAPSWDHWLGTTGQGQDVLAQTVAGAWQTLSIGFSVGLAVVAIGALVGAAAATFGGWVDDVLGLIINIFLVVPGLPLMVVIAAYLPPGATTIGLVLVLTGWAWTARVVRGQAMSLRKRDFVQAAIVAGESRWRIIASEILPNMTSLLASAFIGATVYAIGAQVSLEFLGLGDVSQVTWGTNLYWASNDSALLTSSWWTFVPTGVCLALVGFALVMINGAIDELGNPRLRGDEVYVTTLRKAGVKLGGAATPVLRVKGEGRGE